MAVRACSEFYEPDSPYRYHPEESYRVVGVALYVPDPPWRYEAENGNGYEPDAPWRYVPDDHPFAVVVVERVRPEPESCKPQLRLVPPVEVQSAPRPEPKPARPQLKLVGEAEPPKLSGRERRRFMQTITALAELEALQRGRAGFDVERQLRRLERAIRKIRQREKRL